MENTQLRLKYITGNNVVFFSADVLDHQINHAYAIHNWCQDNFGPPGSARIVTHQLSNEGDIEAVQISENHRWNYRLKMNGAMSPPYWGFIDVVIFRKEDAALFTMFWT